MSPNQYGPHCSLVRPANNWFSIFPNYTKFVIYENNLPVTPNFTKFCILIEWKIGNNFPFGNKFKFEAQLELKFLEEKLLLNLSQIYWGFKPVWKNLINFPTFSFALTFQNVNLDWHGCMAKSEVSIQAPFDLV
jgi:hypothetical protein